MNTYRILEDNMDRLQKKLTRIRTKCQKYGCDFVYREVGEEFAEVTTETGAKETHKYILVECEGTAKVNGWRFAATLEHHDNGNIVRKLIDSVEIPEKYFTCAPGCDHCNAKRHRKDTYVIYNEETQEFKQVGSSCLCDFTHGFDAEAAAAYIALFDELIKGEAPYAGCHSTSYYEVKEVLRYAFTIVNHLGYKPSDYEGSDMNTKWATLSNIRYDNGNIGSLMPATKKEVEEYRNRFNPDFNSEALLQTVEDAIQFVKDNKEEWNSYMHNLKTLIADEYITYKNFGYMVSLVPTYNKHIQKVTEAAERAKKYAVEAAASEYVGKEKDRITITNIESVTCVYSWESMYGMTLRYKIVDEAGHVFMWDSSTGIRDDEGLEVVSIVGTIKKHDEWNGIKQTWLTRCRVTYNKEV